MRFSKLRAHASWPTEVVIGCILALGLTVMAAALATANPQSSTQRIDLAGGVTSIPYQDPIARPARPTETDSDWEWGGTALLYLLAYLVLNIVLTAIIFREGQKRGAASVKPGVQWPDVEKALNASFDARLKEAAPYLPEKVFEETQKVLQRARETLVADVKKVFEKK